MKSLARLLPLLLFACSQPARGYSVLTHQALVDALWDDSIKIVLLKRFPQATEEELRVAHSYAYGGCIIQDLGYYPFGSRFFSDLVHYVRSADFLPAMLEESRDLNEYAFALGAVSHYGADVEGHSLGVNRAVPILYPKLREKFGNVVTYGEDRDSHIRTEFSFDMLQVARGNYAPQKYHDAIGFHVSKELLERAFERTYGLKLEEVFPRLNRALETYRFSVRRLIPEMTKVAWAAKNNEIRARRPDTSRKEFLFNISKTKYEEKWGTDYERPGAGARFLALLLSVVPKVGPLRVFKFKVPPPDVERIFEDSFDASIRRNRGAFSQAGEGILRLLNRDLDTGRPVSPGEYELTDRTYDRLLIILAQKRFAGVTPEIRANILAFYDAMKSPDSHGVAPQVELLRAYDGDRSRPLRDEKP